VNSGSKDFGPIIHGLSGDIKEPPRRQHKAKSDSPGVQLATYPVAASFIPTFSAGALPIVIWRLPGFQ
jgi:hypothetical protein